MLIALVIFATVFFALVLRANALHTPVEGYTCATEEQ